VAQAKEAASAQKQVNRIVHDAITGIKALGIPEEKITTVGLSLWPVYSERHPKTGEQPAEPRIVAHRANNSIRVRVNDLTLVGEIIDAGVSAGANKIEGISFELQSDTEHRKQALFLAGQTARAKAEVIARAMNVRLVSVVEILEGGISVMRPLRGRGKMLAAAADVPTPVQRGEIQIGASVTVRYQIEDLGKIPSANEK
jgi:uncharacterized protein YggE